MIKIREMTPEDAAAVERVEKLCFSVPWSRESFWQEAANENTLYLVACEGEKIIGYVGCWISFGEAQITNVAVEPTKRGAGVGRQILTELFARLKAKGVTAVTLEVRPSNAPALALYEHMGFKDVGRRPHYYTDNDEDAIIMWNTSI